MFGPAGLGRRIQAVAHGAIGSLPAALPARAAAQYDAGNLARLTEAMTAGTRGAKLPEAKFATRFFGRNADDPVVEKLRGAAVDIESATSHADLRAASEQLADAMQAVGLGRWPRFLAEAQDRARAPATVASVNKTANNERPQRTQHGRSIPSKRQSASPRRPRPEALQEPSEPLGARSCGRLSWRDRPHRASKRNPPATQIHEACHRRT